MARPPEYVELHARSAFSFLRAASLPETLADQAARLGLPALALCDRMGVYGAPRLAGTARAAGLRALVGAELVLEDGGVLPVLVESRTGYRHLCELLTRAHLRAPKGEATLRWDELREFAAGLVALTGDEEGPLARRLLGSPGAPASPAAGPAPGPDPGSALDRLVEIFGPDGVYVEVQRHQRRGE
ncbi:MAG: PHP domain-containing protein, partial [Verrucomicrobiota bacterium]